MPQNVDAFMGQDGVDAVILDPSNGRPFRLRNGAIGESMQSMMVIGGALSANAGTPANTTWNALGCAEAPFVGVALVFQSIQPGAIGIASAMVTSVADPAAYPNSADFTAYGLAATFGGSASGSIQAQAGATAAPSIYMSDVMPVPSRAAVDGSGLFYAAGRVYMTNTGYTYKGLSGGVTLTPGLYDGRRWVQSSQAVDGVTTPAAFTNAVPSTNNLIMGMMFLHPSDVRTHLSMGDSTVAGVTSEAGVPGVTGAVVRAVHRVSTPLRPMMVINGGYGGSTPGQYLAHGKRLINALRPTSASMQVGSANEACTSQALQDRHFAMAVDFVQYCRARGVVPYLRTPTPQNLGSSSADQYRQGLRQRVIAWGRDAGVPVADTGGILADSAAPWTYAAGFVNADNIHPTDIGYEAQVPLDMAILRDL